MTQHLSQKGAEERWERMWKLAEGCYCGVSIWNDSTIAEQSRFQTSHVSKQPAQRHTLVARRSGEVSAAIALAMLATSKGTLI